MAGQGFQFWLDEALDKGSHVDNLGLQRGKRRLSARLDTRR